MGTKLLFSTSRSEDYQETLKWNPGQSP